MDKPFDTTQAIDKVKKAVAARAGGGAATAAAPAANVAAPAPAPAPAAVAAKPAPAPAPAPAAKPAAGPFGGPAAANPAQKSRSATLMFGGEVNASKSPGAGPVAPVIPGGNAPPAGASARPIQKPAPELVATAQSASHAPPQPAAHAGAGGGHVAAAVNGQLGAKLGELGLSKDQAEAVMALSREVVERVVWEVVPQLAEVMIREELARLTKE